MKDLAEETAAPAYQVRRLASAGLFPFADVRSPNFVRLGPCNAYSA